MATHSITSSARPSSVIGKVTADPRNFCQLPRPHPERPRCRRATEKSDELAPLHSITSSASSRSDSGIGAARDQPRLRLALDAHVTLAFAAGSVLNIKSGRHVELEQRTIGRQIWAPDDFPPRPTWPGLVAECAELDHQRPDLAVAVGLTHDVAPDVRRYLELAGSTVGRLLALKPSRGAGAQSIVCGRHAFDLAEATAAAIRHALGAYTTTSMLHLFIAAPNGFTFFLGQRQPLLGRVQLYEFDLAGGRDRSYAPALTLPVTSTNPIKPSE